MRRIEPGVIPKIHAHSLPRVSREICLQKVKPFFADVVSRKNTELAGFFLANACKTRVDSSARVPFAPPPGPGAPQAVLVILRLEGPQAVPAAPIRFQKGRLAREGGAERPEACGGWGATPVRRRGRRSIVCMPIAVDTDRYGPTENLAPARARV